MNRVLTPLLVCLIACTEQPAVLDAATTIDAPCDDVAFLRTELYGAIEAGVDWSAQKLQCEGMPRPDNAGARLRLSAPFDDAEDAPTVAFILGIPDLVEGRTATELAVNVTFMEEGAGRFFSTTDLTGCWVDISEHEPISAENRVHRITGSVYCVSPLAELNGTSSLGFTELQFRGRLNWEPPE